MAATTDAVTFSIEVELAKLNAQLATIPDTTKKEAMAATAALKRSFDEATRATKAAAAASSASLQTISRTARDTAGQVRAGYVNLGNQISDVFSQLTTGTSPLTILIQQGPQAAGALSDIGVSASALGGILARQAVNLGVFGLGIAALGAAYAYFSNELDRANDKMEQAAAVSAEITAANAKWTGQQEEIARAVRVANGEITSGVAAAEAQAEAYRAARESTKAFLGEQLNAVKAQIAAQEAQYGAGHATTDLTIKARKLTETIAAYQERTDRTADSILLMAERTDLQAEADKRARDAAEALREEMERRRKLIADVSAASDRDVKNREAIEQRIEDMTQAADDSEAARLTGEQKVQAELLTTVEGYENVRLSIELMGAAGAASADQVQRANKAASRATVEATQTATEEIDRIRADAAAKEAARQEKAAKDAQRLRDQQIAAAADMTRTVGGYLGDVASVSDGVYARQVDTIGQLNAQLAQGEEYLTEQQKAELNNRIRAQEKAARRAFEVAKALRIAQATANAYAAASQAFAEVPYPFNFAAGATALAAGLVNVTQIAATEPAFHRGGMIDEKRITALSGEAVLSRQGVQALGGEQAVNRINSAGGAAAGGPAVYAVSVYRHDRITERWQADGLRRGDPVSRAISASRSVPYGHRS